MLTFASQPCAITRYAFAHAGLREVLASCEAGGIAGGADHLRFDFSHFTAWKTKSCRTLKTSSQRGAAQPDCRDHHDVPIDEAISTYHAMACSAKSMAIRYAWCASAISRPNFAAARIPALREIGLIKILKEGSVSSGVRRVEAIRGWDRWALRKDHELEGRVNVRLSTLRKSAKGWGTLWMRDRHTRKRFASRGFEGDSTRRCRDQRLARELDSAG